VVGLNLSGIHLRDEPLADVKVFASRVVGDERGFFARTSDTEIFRAAGVDPDAFVQESQSRSVHRVLRGLHGRDVLQEAKLVRVAHGAIHEVIVDLRPWSPTFLQTATLCLDDVEHLQVYVPPGCVHGYQALTEVADVCYRMDAVYAPERTLYLAYDDPELAIEWPLDDPIVSDRDRAAPSLAELRPHLADFFGANPPTDTTPSSRSAIA
jgi:dTDP-4-dehydrorhamnose 3,5-epimerase